MFRVKASRRVSSDELDTILLTVEWAKGWERVEASVEQMEVEIQTRPAGRQENKAGQSSSERTADATGWSTKGAIIARTGETTDERSQVRKREGTNQRQRPIWIAGCWVTQEARAAWRGSGDLQPPRL